MQDQTRGAFLESIAWCFCDGDASQTHRRRKISFLEDIAYFSAARNRLILCDHNRVVAKVRFPSPNAIL